MYSEEERQNSLGRYGTQPPWAQPKQPHTPRTPEQETALKRKIRALEGKLEDAKRDQASGRNDFPQVMLVDGTSSSLSVHVRKSMEIELRAWNFDVPPRVSKDLVTIRFLLDYGEFIQELNCPVDMAYLNLRLMSQKWKEARLTPLRTAVSNSRDELTPETLTSDWRTILAYVAKNALPSSQYLITNRNRGVDG